MGVESEANAFNARVKALTRAQQQMEDEGCPHVMAPGVSRRIAIGLATEGFAKDAARLGGWVRSVTITAADSSASRRAVLHGPRIPGGQGNGPARGR